MLPCLMCNSKAHEKQMTVAVLMQMPRLSPAEAQPVAEWLTSPSERSNTTLSPSEQQNVPVPVISSTKQPSREALRTTPTSTSTSSTTIRQQQQQQQQPQQQIPSASEDPVSLQSRASQPAAEAAAIPALSWIRFLTFSQWL
jgi:hypothetical protein